MYSVKSVNRLIGELGKLPGIGEKTAQRLCYYILRMSKESAANLGEAIKEVKERVKYCSVCNNITEQDPCQICRDESRDKSIICVVEEPQDVFLIERLGEFKGLYHVLGGAISPIKGVNPEDIDVEGLLRRVREQKMKEVILATDPNVEGETTAIYIFQMLSSLPVRVTRLAHGLPAGGDLEFADEVTLSQAFQGRREMGAGKF